MKLRLILVVIGTWLIQSHCLEQVPISSIYHKIKNDPSPVVQSVYKLLDDYYFSRISIKQLAQELDKFSPDITGRENAIKNMVISYTKINDGDFGFYNLRLAVNYAETLPDNDVIKGVVFAEFGNYLFNRETYDLAIEFFRKSIPILDNTPQPTKKAWPLACKIKCYEVL